MTALLRPGDWLVLLLGALAVAALLLATPGGGAGEVRIKQRGELFAQLSPRLDREVRVPGPLGDTQVEIRNGRVRVMADPSPRQLCVRQGWLQPGEVVHCLPNQVSVEWGAGRYDSLSY